ncbi:MAG: ABC transporter permease [Thermodesulfobacteriota bacterium]|jgi:ABC-2 type transport system permease protein|nr:MAG: ABC transporter permease [Thermodesulfobacteriota bacterium]
MNWIRIRELVRKEFLQLFRDKKNRPLLVIAPVIQLLVFGYVVSTDVRDIQVGFLDQAHTAESRMVKDGFDANKTFRITHIFKKSSEVEETLIKRKVDLTVTVWPDFSDRIKKGESAPLQIFADGSRSNIAAVRIAYTSVVLDKINQDLLKKIHPEKIDYGRIDERLRTWYNPNLDSQNFFIPGVVAFLILLTTLLYTSMAIIRERENGTMEQLIVTPMKPYELIIGKTIPYVIIAYIQLIIVMLVAVFWFHIPFKGSLLLVFVSAPLFLLSTIGIGLFISTVSATQQQAMMTTFFFLLPFFLLSGLVFPVANMPVVIQWFTHIIPLRFFLVIIRGGFLKGVGFEILWSEMLHLLIIGGVVFFLAVRRFRKRLD